MSSQLPTAELSREELQRIAATDLDPNRKAAARIALAFRDSLSRKKKPAPDYAAIRRRRRFRRQPAPTSPDVA